MKHVEPVEIDPEFAVLPYEDGWDATNLKFWRTVKLEAAARCRKIRNASGLGSIAMLTGVGIAHHVEGVNFGTAGTLLVGIVTGTLAGSTLGHHKDAKFNDVRAAENAQIVANMFTRTGLTPPDWTVPSK